MTKETNGTPGDKGEKRKEGDTGEHRRKWGNTE